MKYTLLSCGLLIATSAFGDTSAPGGAPRIHALDADGDNMISLAEAQAGAPELATRFSDVDSNKDGLLSIDEVIAGQPARKVRFNRSIQEDFAAADVNADGMLTRTEAAGMPMVSEFFAEMDSNADGHVTRDEIREHARTRGPIRVIRERGPGTAQE